MAKFLFFSLLIVSAGNLYAQSMNTCAKALLGELTSGTTSGPSIITDTKRGVTIIENKDLVVDGKFKIDLQSYGADLSPQQYVLLKEIIEAIRQKSEVDQNESYLYLSDTSQIFIRDLTLSDIEIGRKGMVTLNFVAKDGTSESIYFSNLWFLFFDTKINGQRVKLGSANNSFNGDGFNNVNIMSDYTKAPPRGRIDFGENRIHVSKEAGLAGKLHNAPGNFKDVIITLRNGQKIRGSVVGSFYQDGVSKVQIHTSGPATVYDTSDIQSVKNFNW